MKYASRKILFDFYPFAFYVLAIALAVTATVKHWPDSQVNAQQQDKIAASAKATPTPTPAPSLKLTQEEINAASPLWNEYQTQQREITVAIANLRKAAKKPNDREGHSLAVLALAAVLENADAAQGKWNEWMTKAQADHDCKGCEINLQSWEFIKFPAAANTAPK